MRWRNVTNTFSERARHYNGKYLEICEVYDNIVEVSLFNAEEDSDELQENSDEIYFSFGIFYGIIYVEREKANALRQKIKKELVEEYIKNNKEPSRDFINSFAEKYEVCMPNDMFFNFDF